MCHVTCQVLYMLLLFATVIVHGSVLPILQVGLKRVR